MSGIEGTPIPAGSYLNTMGSYNPAAWVYTTAPAPEPEPVYQPSYSYTPSFSPNYFAGDTDQFFRAISAAPGAPYAPGISEPPSPLWAVGGDMETMTIEGSLDGGAIGSPRVSDSMQSNMSDAANAMLLPDGSHDWGKWIIVAGVLVTLYIIGREMGRKGPVR